MTIDTCAKCGAPLDVHDRHIRFTQPEPVLRIASTDSPDVWMSGTDANESVLMQVQGVGAFVRALLPVQLTGGHTVTYGVWVGFDPANLQHVLEVWWTPEYADLQIEGILANVVQPWGLYGTPVSLRVLSVDETPYCVTSPDSRLASVISDHWDHRLILDALP
ncbi:DUF2199 domain-containing protein [Microbacterium sulfonylureivorans]|uniref:DUF2199 domain-containing protein n=1 Tax=Microbacterium sulfonylureivorans TaxID=2486854 RepID=UPI0013E08519|nr:DUF2199 domain-containing protein [Microbacterium sulfonylureivorans]